GHEDGEVWATGQQVGQVRGGWQDLLEIVEQEQHVFITERGFEQIEQGPRCSLFEIEGLGDGGDDQGGVAEGGERNEVDAIGKVSEQVGGDLQGQAGFAAAAGAGEGEEADLGATQEGTDSRYLMLAPKEGRELCGQVMSRGAAKLDQLWQGQYVYVVL